MSRVFAYCRVSTLDQTTENQSREIEAAGFTVRPQRLIEEHISGSVAAGERPGFTRLLDRMENGDVLIVTKLDRLGRNAMDIRKTVEQLAASDIRVHCLALGGVDLTSAAGRMTMQVISAVAEFERDLLLERTHSGIARAKAAGKRFGRPSTLNEEQQLSVIERINTGVSISAIAREFNTTRQTILRVKAGKQ
ncbi:MULTISPECIES: recombinase family protein [Gammaproteobacteria]|uniref:DNA-invertase from lambdoid prophage Rac n=4 Tax=Bacteria TaxID=2 RepID=A0A380BYM5_9GAMM|nr:MULTISPECIES: recombinase family protein [Gammaproteobacteria]EKO3781295.1 recombinase family protein [Vibrio metschnikovii]MEA4110569.1 recombinase family protein [Enterobacter hormaechei]QXN27175.1 recombinase family protein [Shewanella putrefaciens]HBC8832993.1 recombinase family protein [Citrobacter freundii]HBZ2647900.1 recombinase family protein [Klebsiella pneumoniae]